MTKQKIDPVFPVPDYLQASILSTPVFSSRIHTTTSACQYSSPVKPKSDLTQPNGRPVGKEYSKSESYGDGGIFESHRQVIKKLRDELFAANEDDPVYKALFRKAMTLLRQRCAYKDATIEQKQLLIKDMDKEVKLEMMAEDFVVPKNIRDYLASSSKILDLKDENVTLVVLEAKRDIRGPYVEQLKAFDPVVVRNAYTNRCNTAQRYGHPILIHRSGMPLVNRPSRPDLSFLR